MKNIFSKIVAIISVLVLCFSFGGCWLFAEETFVPEYPDSMAASQTVVLETNDNADRAPMTRVAAVAKVERSVVAIKMEFLSVSGKTGTSWGSGVIIDNGNTSDNVFYIITCHHVIDSMGDITVYVPDSKTRNYNDADYDEDFAFSGVITNEIKTGAVTLIGGDKLADIAVLKLDVTGSGVSASDITYSVLPPDTYNVMRGEDVFSVGNPNGDLPMTVSSGVVSYLDREVGISDVGYMTLMQIDVQINPGNSGGGLFNLYGELIGITSAGNTEMDGLNYAIPYVMSYESSENMGFINTAKQLIATYTTFGGNNYGYVEGHWALGITIAEYKNSITGEVQHVYVTSVVTGSDADNAGIKENDILEKVAGNSIKSASDLSSVIYSLKKTHAMGDSLVIRVQTGNSYVNRTLTLSQNIFCDTGYVLPVAA